MQEIFFKIGRTGKYSLYDYMDFLDVLGERKNGKHLLVDLLFFLTIAAAFVSPPLGLCGVSAVMCFNITTYLKEKKQIEPYLTSFHYIFRLIRGAEELSEIHAQQLEGRLSKVRKLLPQFGKLNRSASLGMRTSSGDPMGIVADYINMMLHLDIIGFNIMLHAVRKQTENIDRLVTIVGELDALIVCGSPSKNYLRPLGAAVGHAEAAVLGDEHRSNLLEAMSFGSFAARFADEKSRFAWCCSDPEVVREYEENPLCGFTFSDDAFFALNDLLKETYGFHGWHCTNRKLPVLFLSGGDDPCYVNVRRFKKSIDHMRLIGYRNVRGKLYPGMRHEILNETDRKRVYHDIAFYIKKKGF